MLAWLTWATATQRSSRWKATITPLTSNPIRARQRALAASCATFSPWVRALLPISTPYALAIQITPKRAIWFPALFPALLAMAIALACRPLPANAILTLATTAIFWSMPCVSASPKPTVFFIPPPRALVCRLSMLAQKPAATASTAPPWRRPSLTTRPTKSGPLFRSAIPSQKNCSLKPVLNSCRKM